MKVITYQIKTKLVTINTKKEESIIIKLLNIAGKVVESTNNYCQDKLKHWYYVEMPCSSIVTNDVEEEHVINLNESPNYNLQQIEVLSNLTHPRSNELLQLSFTTPFAYKINSK